MTRIAVLLVVVGLLLGVAGFWVRLASVLLSGLVALSGLAA